ncbi:hypothetical protein [Caulobacter sp. 17J65-9]|uniref:hypothetical protein n=1 Tax=Caulobacter sp. 17J65-9 TaxID=2709382 RepID=UPI0013CD8949|nr:hypothetical protein [Caulobacter sp. 17J65-9]NEX95250.1 hypothetical protein [Caulobacter sp. 17J65-9]
MTPYLFYVFGRPGADDLYVLNCADDREARARAEWLLTLHPGRDRVEAWDEARPVWIAEVEAPAPSLAVAA